MMRIGSAFALLLVSATLRAQGFLERPVSDIRYDRTWEELQAAGTDGKDFLVAGYRGGEDPSGDVNDQWPRPRLWAHRVTESGEVLDQIGIRFPMPESDYSHVLGIFWAGDAYTILFDTARRL